MQIIGIGTDIIECARIAEMLEKHGEHFLDRVFTSGELIYCAERKAANQHYAGRWAAKEAVLKALGTGWAFGIKWTDVEVKNEMGGAPKIILAGVALEIATKLGIDRVLISISHCREYATAYAVAVGA